MPKHLIDRFDQAIIDVIDNPKRNQKRLKSERYFDKRYKRINDGF